MRTMVLAYVMTFTAHGTSAQTARREQPPEQRESPTPEVQIEAPADAPLRLSVNPKWVTSIRHGLELYVVVENVGGADVRAYATRDSSGDVGDRVCMLYNAPARGKVLKHGQTHGMSTWRSFDPEASAVLKRSLDFVEFGDGTTWGSDVCQSADSLAGQRAGASEVAKLLRKVFAEGGAVAVAEALKSDFREIAPPQGDCRSGDRKPTFEFKNDLPKIAPPQDRSAVWREGFCGGVKAYVERIRQALHEYGEDEIETALRRPYDASGAGAP